MTSKKTRLIILGLIFLGFFGFTKDSKAAQINLPQDANGWTIFTPSADSRIMYVATEGAATGAEGIYNKDDAILSGTPFTPGAVLAYPTYAAAYANTRDGYPDWVLVHRGDTFEQNISANFRSGRSATEPFLIAAYGSSGLSPMFKTGANNAISNFGNSFRWIALSGLSFYANTRDPDSVDYTGPDGASFGLNFQTGPGTTAEGLLIEGCKFSFYETNGVGTEGDEDNGAFDGATIRRTVFTDSYQQGTHTQNLWSNGIKNLIIDECVFDHGGWYDEHDGTIGVADALSHNTYFSSVQNVTFKNNIFSRPSSTGNKFTAGIDSYGIKLINNLYIDCEEGIDIGTNHTENRERFFATEITNNVFTLTGLTHPSGYQIGWGVVVGGWAGGIIDKNLFVDSGVTISDANTFRFYYFNRDVTITNNVDVGQVDTGQSVRWIYTLGDENTGTTITDNKFEASGSYDKFVGAASQPISGVTFANNTWYSPATTNFYFDTTSYTESQWLAAVEPTANFIQPVYPDRTRNIQTYMASIGMTNTVDAFYAATRNQDRYNWDPRLDADTVNSWIRAGFFESADTTPPSSPHGLAVQ